MNTNKTDPLYMIFEQHLYHFEDVTTERKVFIEGIIKDYIKHLADRHLTIPKPLLQSFYEDHFELVNQMLIKKIYGHFSIEEFQQKNQKHSSGTLKNSSKS